MVRSRSFAGLRVGVVLLLSGVITACGAIDSLTRPAASVVTGVAPVTTMIPSSVATQPPAGLMDVIWQRDGAPLRFLFPIGLAADGRGHLYAAEAGNTRLQQMTGAGQPAAQWGSYGAGQGQFVFQGSASSPLDGNLPTGVNFPIGGNVAADAEGTIYVADPLNDRIQKFDLHGQFVATWGRHGTDGGAFSLPVAVAVDRQGQVYVADRDNHRIQVFDQRGAFLRMWGSQGSRTGEFNYPMAIAVDYHGQVYVADGYNHRVQKFDRAGRFLTAWGAPGDQPGEFGGPMFLAVDGQGRVYAADTYNRRVQVFDGEGIFLGEWGHPGSGAGQFAYPTGIVVDERGDIYVADMVNGTIQMFRPRGAWPVAAPVTATPRPLTATPAPIPTPLSQMTPTDR